MLLSSRYMQTGKRRIRLLHVFCISFGLLLGATLLITCLPRVWKHGKRNARLIFRQPSNSTSQYTNIPLVSSPEWRPWLQNHEIQVSAIVFYGRRQYVRVLEKYLKRNMWTAGGILNEVQWLVRTEEAADLDWLDKELVPSDPGYKRVDIDGEGWASCYKKLASKRYYLKIDDDIMYIKDRAIDAMLREKLTNRFWIVSANVINHTILTWVHAAMDAMTARHPSKIDEGEAGLIAQAKLKLLRQEPFAAMQYHPFDACTWKSSQCAAVTHYAFLESLQHNTTEKYDFKRWDFHAFEYRRWSINIILFKGSDLNTADIGGDDEQSISADLPREQGRHCGAVGEALAVHLAYGPQRNDGADGLLPLFEDLAIVTGGALLPDKLVNGTFQS